mgnify:CR=1 FL=1
MLPINFMKQKKEEKKWVKKQNIKIKEQYLDLDCYPYTASSTMLLKDFVARADKVLVTWSDKYKDLKVNESTYHDKEVVHALENLGDIPLILIEVQVGSYLGEDDIVRFKDSYGRQREITDN